MAHHISTQQHHSSITAAAARRNSLSTSHGIIRTSSSGQAPGLEKKPGGAYSRIHSGSTTVTSRMYLQRKAGESRSARTQVRRGVRDRHRGP